jgi:bacterial/archaeal transporter family-2 protein
MFTAIPVIGTAAAVGLTVAGQQVASLFVDRHGWFRLPQREITRPRLSGVALLLIGVATIQLSSGVALSRTRERVAVAVG